MNHEHQVRQQAAIAEIQNLRQQLAELARVLKERDAARLAYTRLLGECIMAFGEGVAVPGNGHAPTFDRVLVIPSSGVDYERDAPSVPIQPGPDGGAIARLVFKEEPRFSQIEPATLPAYGYISEAAAEEPEPEPDAQAEQEAADFLEDERRRLREGR